MKIKIISGILLLIIVGIAWNIASREKSAEETRSVRVEHEAPEGWIKNTDRDNYLLVMFDQGFDPTQIFVGKLDLSLSKALKQEKEIPIKTEEVTLDGRSVLKHVYNFPHNECSSIKYFHKIDSNMTGIVTITAVCPTHSEGYDALKITVAESVRFIIEE